MMSNDQIQMAIDALEEIRDDCGDNMDINANDMPDWAMRSHTNAEQALNALRQHQQDGGWRNMDEAPKDGSTFYARYLTPIKWKPYKPTSQEFKRGKMGRWQAMNEYGGWDNLHEVPSDWLTKEEYDAQYALPPAPKKENDYANR